MNNTFTKKRVFSSLLWKLLERAGNQVIQLVIQVILARLLIPEYFGSIAIVMVFSNLAGIFVQSGLNTALIQKKDSDQLDFSSVFYLSLLIALFFYLLIFLAAPFIGEFYRDSELGGILRVFSLILFPGALNSVQNAYIARNLLFRKNFFSSLIAIGSSALLSIGAAYIGFGVWSLVIQQLTNQIVISIVLWFSVKWRPRLSFSFQRIKILFSFGSKLLLSGLLNTSYRSLRPLIVGKFFTPVGLGYYNWGELVPQVLVGNIDGAIQAVMLPTLSSAQEDLKTLKQMVRRTLGVSTFLLFPMMFGLAAVAEPLIRIVLTEKWLPAVPFLQIFCFCYILYPMYTVNLQAMNALGRSDLFLKLEVIKKVIGLGILAVSIPYGIYAIAVGQLFSALLETFIDASPSKKLFGYGYGEQLKDIYPNFIIAAIMGVSVYSLNIVNLPVGSLLALQIVVGVILYVLLAKLTGNKNLSYLLDTIKETLCVKKY